MMSSSTGWFLYIIRTDKNRLYTGITTDVLRRLQTHQKGKGAKALRGCTHLSVVYSCYIGSRSLASQYESKIKKLSKAQKETLVNEQWALDCLITL